MLLTAGDGAHGRADRVRWADAAAAGRLGLLSRDMQHRRIIDGAFAAVGAEPRPVVETNSIATLYAHARDGLAAAVMAHTWLRLFPVPPGMRAVPPRSPSSAGRSAWCGSIADPSRSCRGR
ncbi:MAG TPA: LysR family transcriptional regulator substrate-binding protein [Solirubrobacteraceae bacterium]|nr:LysR family transcriptional regulator substrate-binding protein [Solirubrobacteraceae bacterium]